MKPTHVIVINPGSWGPAKLTYPINRIEKRAGHCVQIEGWWHIVVKYI